MNLRRMVWLMLGVTACGGDPFTLVVTQEDSGTVDEASVVAPPQDAGRPDSRPEDSGGSRDSSALVDVGPDVVPTFSLTCQGQAFTYHWTYHVANGVASATVEGQTADAGVPCVIDTLLNQDQCEVDLTGPDGWRWTLAYQPVQRFMRVDDYTPTPQSATPTCP